MGGSSSSTGQSFTYFGSLVQIICLGPVHRLTKIRNGDTIVWEGDIDQTSRDAYGKTILASNLGTLKFYWGRDDQSPDAELQVALIDYGTGPTTVPIPSWKNICYIVGSDVAFGQQPVPPTLSFEFEKRLDLLPISAHEISGDAVLPEVIYDLFSNALYSVGISPARLDLTSFVNACETIIDEGLGVSPFFDDAKSLRDAVGGLLHYIDAFMRYEGGVIKIVLIRKQDTSSAVVIDESKLIEEPQIENGGWNETWNFTRLVFNDRENNWDNQAVEPYDDHANAAVVGEMVCKDVDMPFVTRRSVAKILAKRKGIAGGMQQTRYTLKLMPSLRTLKPGDLISVSFAKLGLASKIMRIMEKNGGGTENRSITVHAVAELTRDESNDFVPPADPIFNVGAFFDAAGNLAQGAADVTPRLLWLPVGLKANDPDGFLTAFARPNTNVIKYKLFWSYDPNTKPYKRIDADNNFAIHTTVLGWEQFRNRTRWLLRILFDSQDDADYIRQQIEQGEKVYFVAARRIYKGTGSTINQHQPDGLWFQADVNGRATPVSGLMYDIECTEAAFGSASPILETTSGEANYPTINMFCGRKKDFAIHTDANRYFEIALGNGGSYYDGTTLLNTDTNLIRWIKVTTGTADEFQAIADVTATTFDRDDTTMSPNGTLSVSWGAECRTLYEAYDLSGFAKGFGGTTPYDATVADIDLALHAAMFGLATTDQLLTIESLDQVLAFMAQTGIDFYNTMF